MTIKKGKIVITSILCSLLLIFSVSFIPFNNEEYVYADTTREVEKFTQLQSGIEYKIGERKYFYENYVNNKSIEYVLVANGAHCYIWSQYDLWVGSIIQDEYDLIQRYVDRIYETMSTEVFNHAHSWGDVDNDACINILLTDLSTGNVKGYFESKDLRLNEKSNFLDIIYMDLSDEWGFADLKNEDGKEFRATIAHEFQHMLFEIACLEKGADTLSEALWFNESLSAASAYLYSNDRHYIDETYFPYFLLDYGTVNGFLFTNLGQTNGKEYLMTSLFGTYICHQVGESVLKEIYSRIESNITAEKLLEDILCEKFSSFDDIFFSFMSATVFDGLWAEKYTIFSEDINYNSTSYRGLYALRKDNDLLYNYNQNLGKVSYADCAWQEKIFFYNKSYFAGMRKMKLNSSADKIYYLLINAGKCQEYVNEIKTNGDEVIVVFINSKTSTLDLQTIIITDTRITRSIIITIASLVALSAVVAFVFTLVKHKKKGGK